jgi:hypothetical protein
MLPFVHEGSVGHCKPVRSESASIFWRERAEWIAIRKIPLCMPESCGRCYLIR